MKDNCNLKNSCFKMRHTSYTHRWAQFEKEKKHNFKVIETLFTKVIETSFTLFKHQSENGDENDF